MGDYKDNGSIWLIDESIGRGWFLFISIILAIYLFISIFVTKLIFGEAHEYPIVVFLIMIPFLWASFVNYAKRFFDITYDRDTGIKYAIICFVLMFILGLIWQILPSLIYIIALILPSGYKRK